MLGHFCKKYKPKMGIVITREKECKMEDDLYLPLRYFRLVN